MSRSDEQTESRPEMHVILGRPAIDREDVARRRRLSRVRSLWKRQPLPESVIDSGTMTINLGSSVYIAFGEGGRLLYVGLTDSVPRRLAAHAATSAWWASARTVRWETYRTRHEAAVREAFLIRSLQPPFNTKFSWPVAP